MKLFRVIAVAAAFVMVVPALGRTQGGPPNQVHAHFDIPADNGFGFAEVDQTSFYIAGWALDCQTGTIPQALFVGMSRLSVTPPGGSSTWVPNTITVVPNTYRPDVAAAFSGLCPSVTNYSTGYAIYVDPPPPTGYWRIFVVWANTNGAQSAQTMILDID